MSKGKLFLTLAIAFFSGVFNACDAATDTRVYSSSWIAVDPLFEKFYRDLGGEEVVGRIIFPRFEVDGLQYQYTEKVLMMFDPQASKVNAFHLANLASLLRIGEPPEAPPEELEKVVYLEGFVVWKEALPLYNRMGGIAVVGAPVTRLSYNPAEHRFEQYFEGAAYFREESTPDGPVRLLEMGVWGCVEACPDYVKGSVPRRWIDPPSDEVLRRVDEYMNITAYRLGIENTGYPLTATTINPQDGSFEKVFENMVLVADVNNLAHPYPRKISDSVGINPEPPQPMIPGVPFFPKEGDLGYSVMPEIDEHIHLHGGYEVFGMPIGNEYARSHTVTRQCFENLCLDKDKTAPTALRIRPAPLGHIYMQLFYRLPDAITFANIAIETWTGYPVLPPNLEQTVSAIVFENDLPVSSVDLEILWLPPDSPPEAGWLSQYMGKTDENGLASANLGYFPHPGDVIVYKVCILGLLDEEYCQQGGFVTWGNP